MTERTKRRSAPRGTLSRDVILDAAFRLLQTTDLDALSMPEVARTLGVGVTSLYWYVANKDELLELLAERAAAVMTLDDAPPSSLPWDALLVAHFRQVHERLKSHPGLVELILRRGMPTPDTVDIDRPLITTHARVQSMVDAGIPAEAATRGYLTIALYTLGYSAWAAARSRNPSDRISRRQPLLGDNQAWHSVMPSAEGFDSGLQMMILALRAEIKR